MAKFKKSDFRPARERIVALPKARRARIEGGASKILLAMHLSEIRKALDVIQAKLAHRAGLTQAEVSRIENNLEKVQLRTMERYVRRLGRENQDRGRLPGWGPCGNPAAPRQAGQIEGQGRGPSD